MTPPAATVRAPVVRIQGLRRTFAAGRGRAVALEEITAAIPRGGVTGLVGPDGAGKTTLLRLVAGLLLPDAGRLEVLGADASREPDRIRGHVGYMPQRFGLYEDLTVTENLTLYADLSGLPRESRPARFRELMDFTGLARFGARLAGRLSGGMKQKLGLACTLVHPPELLLLDEPSVGVDPLSRRELWRIVRELAADRMTVVWSTAYLDEAERCDSVLVLHEGRLLAQGRPSDFLGALAGRTFAAPTLATSRRAAARALIRHPAVLDAVIQGSRVRIVLEEGASRPEGIASQPDGEPLRFEPVPPRFEDALVAMLRRQPVDPGPAAGPAPPPRSRRAPGARPSAAAPAARLPAGPVIAIRDLTRDFGDFRAVDRVSFEIARGEIFGLLGPNGAGKSTTFRMLCGLLPPSGGEARVLGIDLRTAAPAARARIGYMSQRFSLYGVLSAAQNLDFFGAAYGLPSAHRRARSAALLEEFGLTALRDQPSGELPLGHKQRLALAAALLHEPEILFLDEPTSGVDPLARREFWERINDLAAAGVTVMVTTHFLDEAEYCDRLGIIYRGRLIAVGPPDELKRRHRTPEHPDPTLDDAFVALIQEQDREEAA